MTTEPPPTPPAGRRARGVQAVDVARTADALLRAGERPTVEKIRATLGTGSPNTINPLLDHWWRGLSQRLETGPKALQRLPEEVIHAAEDLWLVCLEQARSVSHGELQRKDAALASKQSEHALRAEVLKLREQELTARLSDRDQTIGILESEAKAFATLFKREQAKSAAADQRVMALQGELESVRKVLASLSIRTALRRIPVQKKVKRSTKKVANKTSRQTTRSRATKHTRKKSLRQAAGGTHKRPRR